jgi:hypothetical protein
VRLKTRTRAEQVIAASDRPTLATIEAQTEVEADRMIIAYFLDGLSRKYSVVVFFLMPLVVVAANPQLYNHSDPG